ncbi:MAG: methionine--tRNA ligase [Patescibacteria group bacterium]|nr:methionine--tRNA ligase [Patescibacteria group bacterium]
MDKFYITAAIPYVNSRPHVGHVLEFIQADVVARYHKLLKEEVLLLSGGDENALKNVQAAEKAKTPIQSFVDKNSEVFHQLTLKLNTQYDIWQKGSDQKTHFPSSQKLWELCAKNGDIYKKSYEGLYCVGCETFYSLDELDEKGECFEHPGKKLDKVSEENYFFKLSKYQDKLIELIESKKLEIIPEFRKNEVLSFLKSGLHDLSISRSNERAKNWGIPVPGDSTQRIYVWFDALNIYQSGVGFGWNDKLYQKWWPADLHVIGKGITRFHAVYWPAFLLSAGLELPKKIFVHGYFTVNGQKMSKTVGNVYDPVPLLEKYGADPLRYYCLAKVDPFKDGDFSEEKFINAYNSDLANGLGNLVARIAKLCETNNVEYSSDNTYTPYSSITGGYHEHLKRFEFNFALEELWRDIKNLDGELEHDKPWSLSKDSAIPLLKNYVRKLLNIAFALQPFLPETAAKILEQFKGPKIKAQKPLFPRI